MLIAVLPVPLALLYGLVVVVRNRRLPGYRPSPAVTVLLSLVASSSVMLALGGAYYAHVASEPRYRAGNEWADLSFAIAVGALVYGVVIFALSLVILIMRRHRRDDQLTR